MRTYIATLCAAAVFASAPATPTCADMTKKLQKACDDANAAKADKAVLKTCTEAVATSIKAAQDAKPPTCTGAASGASTLLAGAAAVATMAALF